MFYCVILGKELYRGSEIPVSISATGLPREQVPKATHIKVSERFAI